MIYWIFCNLIILIFNVILLEKYFHVYQLKDYNNARYIKFFNGKIFIFLFYIAIFILEIILHHIIAVVLLNLLCLVINIGFSCSIIKAEKTPLKYTNKIKRLYLISAIILAIPCMFKFGASISILALMFVPIIANFFNVYDKILNKKFIKSAQKKLSESGAKIIAITGSNGKTSVKNILAKMLTEFNVLSSPKSYNTPLGIAKFVNESNLTNCQFLILEYGARHKGDVKKLCKLFGADYGIITTVAPQHLESFKTMHNIYKTKEELADFLNEKLCVFNLDNIYTFKMFCNKTGFKIGISIYAEAEIFATDLKIFKFNTHFKLNYCKNEYPVCTKLLGRHNTTNILLASALALKLGVSVNHVLDAIKNLNYVPHRLQLIKSNVNILDDSYNCSLASAKEAMFVLNCCPNKKVVATPGIIECGDAAFEINFELGRLLATANQVIVVGETNKNAITRGLQSKNFKNIIYAKNLEEAKKFFVKLNKNDTLLLLNDLPDDYK